MLKDILRNVLEESRMVLPGIQALFGFQLVSVFNNTFAGVPFLDKVLHMMALLLTIMAVACLMAPASYHRQTERDSVSQEFVDYASKLLCVGMAPLLLSICFDTYVVCNVITTRWWVATLASFGAFIGLLYLWYLVPIFKKLQRS